MAVLILADHNNIELLATTRSLVTAASKLNMELHILVSGYECESVASQASKLANVTKVLLANEQAYKDQLAENIAALISDLATSYKYILAAANTTGKNILPRAAGILGVELVSDVIEMKSADTFIRPIYAGNAIETVQNIAELKLLTIRTTSFEKCDANSECKIEAINIIKNLELSEYISREEHSSEHPKLSTAKIVVAGGRGLQNKDNFKLIEELATVLNAAVGASRAAVDAEFVPNDYQVGQTGKIVAPNLYIAVGISGAIQHLAGMKDSKVIVAINKDQDAPIFEIADYGLVADLFEVLPKLTKALSNKA